MEVCFFHHHASVSERYWINRPSAAAITHMLMYCYKSTAYNTLDHSVLPPMWQQFVFGSAVFQQDKVPLCTKPDSLKKRLSHSLVWKNLTGMQSQHLLVNWNNSCEPGLITQHQCWTWIMGAKTCSLVFWHLVKSLKAEEWRLYIHADLMWCNVWISISFV